MSLINILKTKFSGSSTYDRIVRGSFWVLLGTIFSRGSILLSSIALARILGVEDFGEIGVIQNTINMFSVFAGFGIGITATKYISEFKNFDKERTANVISFTVAFALAFGLSVGFIIFSLSDYLALHTLAAPHISPLLKLSSLIVFGGAVSGCSIGILAGFENFKSVAKINIISGIFTLPLVITGAWLYGVVGAVTALLVKQFIVLLISILHVNKVLIANNIFFSFKNFYMEKNLFFKFSLPAAFASIVAGPSVWISTAIIVNTYNGYVEIGIFNAANQWFMLMCFLPNIISQALIPIISEKLKSDSVIKTKKIVLKISLVNFAVCFPLVALLSVSSKLLMGFYGEGFASSWDVLIVSLLGSLFFSFQTPLTDYILSSGNAWFNFIINFVWGINFIFLTYVFSDMGAMALVLSRALAYFIHSFPIAYFFIRR